MYQSKRGAGDSVIVDHIDDNPKFEYSVGDPEVGHRLIMGPDGSFTFLAAGYLYAGGNRWRLEEADEHLLVSGRLDDGRPVITHAAVPQYARWWKSRGVQRAFRMAADMASRWVRRNPGRTRRNPEHVHQWEPVPDARGKYRCACGAHGARRLKGEHAGQIVIERPPSGKIHVASPGNSRLGKRGPGGGGGAPRGALYNPTRAPRPAPSEDWFLGWIG